MIESLVLSDVHSLELGGLAKKENDPKRRDINADLSSTSLAHKTTDVKRSEVALGKCEISYNKVWKIFLVDSEYFLFSNSEMRCPNHSSVAMSVV